MENSKDFFANFDLINAYELKGRFCQKMRFYCDCLSLNCSHFLTVWATDPRLVPNERYFDVVLGEKRRQRYFQRVIPPNINDIVVSGNIFLQNWLSVDQMHSRLKVSLSVEFFPKSTSKYLSFGTNLASVAQTV